MASTKKQRPKAKTKAKARPRAGKAKPLRKLKLLLAGLFVSGFLVVVLVGLALFRHSFAPPEVQTVSSPAQAKSPAVSPSETLESKPPASLRQAAEEMLWTDNLRARRVKVKTEQGRTFYELEGGMPDNEFLGRVRSALAGFGQARLESHARSREVRILWQEQPYLTFVFHPRPSQPRTPLPGLASPPVRARVAIIMDDLGRDLETARALAKIDLPITFSILPAERGASRVAALAHEHGREVMLHIPMEPLAYPTVNPGSDALLVQYSAEEIRQRFRGLLEKVPYIVGGNNHMGSRFTQDRAGMQVVLEEMKAQGLFFVDSLTSGRSVGLQVAHEVQLPSLGRDRFLDNVQQTDRIAAEIRGLAELALRKGEAVGICHPYPQTLEALRREAGYFREKGVEVVAVSALLKPETVESKAAQEGN